jgi:hypothetical protein
LRHIGGRGARLRSRVGAVDGEAMPGVVCLPRGSGHDRPGARPGVAARSPGVSINDVIDDQPIDALSGTAVLNGMPVTVEPMEVAALA